MPVVKMPDGTQVRFPDEMPPDQIRSMIVSKFPDVAAQAPQPANAVQDWARQRADLVEGARQPGAFSDATDSVIGRGIPFGDEISAGMQAPFRAAADWWGGEGLDLGRSYDRSVELERELQRRRDDRSPIASTVGAVAGGTVLGNAAAKGGLTLMQGAKPTLGSLMARGAGEGAAYGAFYGLGEGEGINERALQAAKGSIIGGAAGAATGALSRAMAGKSQVSAPSVDDLRAAGNAAYQQADQAGVIFTPNAVNRLNTQITDKLTNLGYDPALQPGAAAVVRRLGDLQGQNVTLSGLDTLRKVASNGFIPGNKSNNKAVSQIVEAIDDIVTNPSTNDILTGNAQAASSALKQAREMWSRLSKAERVSGAISRAELRAASTGSGGNVDNAIRQNLRRILENPRGFTQAEQDALRKVVTGTKGQNALRLAGKLSPQGNGLMAALGIGGTMVNPLIGVASLGGMGAKSAADALTRGNVGALDSIIRSGGAAQMKNLSPILKALMDASSRTGGQLLPSSTN
ncbi:hypothetical protein [Brucella pituitosa]